MKIIIYETVHLDWVIPYAELFAEEDVTVSFITSSAFKNDLAVILDQDNSRFKWFFFNPIERIIEFSKKFYFILKSANYDLLILNNIDARHLIVFIILIFTRPKKILINLHAINNFFKIKLSLSIRTNIRSLGKKLLTYLTNGYIVNAENMKEYMVKNRLTRKPVYWLPPVYYKPQLSNINTSPTNTIVIPGSIDERRRNYILVLEVIKEILDRQIPIKWILAGRPVGNYGISIIKKAKELNDLGADIHFYKEEIPEQEFQKIVATSSLILSPLVSLTTIHDNIPEVYGESKGSGNVYDAIRHAKPLIIPFTVAIPKEIVSSCIVYQSKGDLVKQLLEIVENHSILTNYTQNAERNSLKFTKEKIRNMFKAALIQ